MNLIHNFENFKCCKILVRIFVDLLPIQTNFKSYISDIIAYIQR